MAREDLIPMSKRTKDEQKKIASKGGKASGKVRRKKADLKRAFETILKADVHSDKAKEQLESMGFEATNEMLLALSTFQQAAKGNQKAVENIIKLTSAKDKYDIAEQKARTEALKLKNKIDKAKFDLETDSESETIGFVFERGELNDGD